MAGITVRAGVVTEAGEIVSRPVTDVSLLLMLDKPSVAKLRGALPSQLQPPFNFIAGRPPGPHVTLAELVVAEGHDHLEQVMEWLERNGAQALEKLEMPGEVTFSTGLLIPRVTGIRLVVEPHGAKSELTSLSATLPAVAAQMGKACGLAVTPRVAGPSQMHISIATFRETERSSREELAFDDDALATTRERDGSVELHASSASLVLATQAPYSEVTYYQQVSLGRSISAE